MRTTVYYTYVNILKKLCQHRVKKCAFLLMIADILSLTYLKYRCWCCFWITEADYLIVSLHVSFSYFTEEKSLGGLILREETPFMLANTYKIMLMYLPHRM